METFGTYSLLVFVVLLLPEGSLQQSCPPAPTAIQKTQACGQVSGSPSTPSIPSTPSTARPPSTPSTPSTARPPSAPSPPSSPKLWLYRLWNRFITMAGESFDMQEREELDPLIVNGAPATITEAPFMAFAFMQFNVLGYRSNSSCSASILNERWILTAAHCINSFPLVYPVSVDVLVGTADLYGVGTRVHVDSWRIHYDWNPLSIYNGRDIALLHLSTPLTFNTNIQPICYPESDNVLGTAISTCDQKIYGWGRTDVNDTVPTTILQKLDVTLTESTTACSNLTDGRVICVKGDPPSSSTCSGDSGGPLVVRYGGRAFVTGIDSYKSHRSPTICGTGYSGYTRTATFSPWVAGYINA